MAAILRAHRATWSFLAAVAAPPAVAAVFVPLRSTLSNVAAALLFVALIEGLAIWGRRLCGYAATIGAALWFDFFLTPPYDRFTISHRPDLETTISLAVVGVIVTELAARSRAHRERAGAESAHVTSVAALAEMVAQGAGADEVLVRLRGELVSILSLRACDFEAGTGGPPHARILPDGSVVHVGLRWPVEEIGIPGPCAEIPCRWRGREQGRLLVTPSPGQPVSREDRVAAVALVNVATAVADAWRHEQDSSHGAR